MNTSADETTTITVRCIPEAERLEMLPKHFGRYLLVIENLIYHFARRLVPSYTGGYRCSGVIEG